MAFLIKVLGKLLFNLNWFIKYMTVRDFLKTFLSEKNKFLLRKFLFEAGDLVFKLISKSSFLRKVYFVFLSSEFDDEMRGIVTGRLKYVENRSGKEDVNYFLRRSIHRIEKGLTMQPLRKIFALDYISQTVDVYVDLIGKGKKNSEIEWAGDILEEYFGVTSKHPVIDEAFEKYKKCHSLNLINNSSKMKPYKKGDLVSPRIDYLGLEELISVRRSVRWYDDKKVERHKIDKALLLALNAPSACNRHPIKYKVIDDKEQLLKVKDLPMGTAGFSDNIPVMVAVIGRLRAYPYSRDRHVIYIDGALSAMQFVLGLESQGISSCILNWPENKFKNEVSRKVLGLENDEKIIMWIALGYGDSDGLVPFSPKIPLDLFREYNW